MISCDTHIRIAYADTDPMGFVYYGNYPTFYERGRTELIRSVGMSYRQMEDMGIMMPVRSLSAEYIKPARYDDLIRIRTIVSELPTARMNFNYEIFNEENELLHKAFTCLIFLDSIKRKPVKVPDFLLHKLMPFFEN